MELIAKTKKKKAFLPSLLQIVTSCTLVGTYLLNLFTCSNPKWTLIPHLWHIACYFLTMTVARIGNYTGHRGRKTDIKFITKYKKHNIYLLLARPHLIFFLCLKNHSQIFDSL